MMIVLSVLLLTLIVTVGVKSIIETKKQDRTYLWKPVDNCDIDKKLIKGLEL